VIRRTFVKPDGRELHLYSRRAIALESEVPSPTAARDAPNPHIRWHPLRGEWVVYAVRRQHRTFLPEGQDNPLAPIRDATRPTELPRGDYEVAVFDNLFPALSQTAHDPPALAVSTRPGLGNCEVVVFTQDSTTSLGALPLSRIELILEVWAERYQVLGAHPDVQYVFPFENRGVEVGVTLHHPHGQIYAYPFVPPIPARELALERAHLEQSRRGLLETLIEGELSERRRLIYEGSEAVAFVPLVARYAYEVWIAPRRRVPSLATMDRSLCADLARALKTVLMKYDALWQRPFPYVLVTHQAPTDGLAHPEAHLHFEFYPPYRMKDRLKYLAGSELGAGVFTADTDPNESAAQLQAVDVDLG
jgi:UDPglucose--hexose-1-phosphate uridylyltransferase